jgi:hypothetical protein
MKEQQINEADELDNENLDNEKPAKEEIKTPAPKVLCHFNLVGETCIRFHTFRNDYKLQFLNQFHMDDPELVVTVSRVSHDDWLYGIDSFLLTIGNRAADCTLIHYDGHEVKINGPMFEWPISQYSEGLLLYQDSKLTVTVRKNRVPMILAREEKSI